MLKGASEDEELVKYMSKVPSYLQRGENFYDNVLSFGVLDWGRLEQWTHKRENVSVGDNMTKPALAQSREQPITSTSSNPALAHSINSVNYCVDVKKKICKKGTYRRRISVKMKSSNYIDKYLGHDSSYSDCEGLEKLSRKLSNSDDEVLQCAEDIERLKLDSRDESSLVKQQDSVLLFPKDFSSTESSKEHRRASIDGKSAEFNWGSFSDIFSIDENHPEESSEVPFSGPLDSSLEIEKDLDLKLDTLIKSQGVEIPENRSDKSRVEVTSNSIPKTSMDRNVLHCSSEIHRDDSLHWKVSSGLARMTRSLSFRESSRNLSKFLLSSKPEHCSTYREPRNTHKAGVNARAKVSPFRRFLDPIFRSKGADHMDERSDDLMVKPVPIRMNHEHEPPTIKAILHFTVKRDLPLFKFVVGKNDEGFASTVKKCPTTLGKDDMSWLYTFYTVQKIRRRSSTLKNHQQKNKPSRLEYNVVGQMKVSKLRSLSSCEQKSKERHMVKESVLYNVEVSKADGVTSEIKTRRELAAVVVNMPFYSEDDLNDRFSVSGQQKAGHIAVILPGGDHSLPQDSVPSSLINRWRNGGLCDCGGWDIGCKLRVLTEKWQQHKYLQVHCDLYDQEAKQDTPFFSLIPLRDGLYSVEYDVQMSSLQAFSISVALINSHNQAYSMDATKKIESKHELGSTKASMAIDNSNPEKQQTPHPPLSPVGRV